MALQLKDGNSSEVNSENKRVESGNPWDIPGKDTAKEEYRTITAPMAVVEPPKDDTLKRIITGAIVAMVVMALLLIVGKAIKSAVLPEGKDITSLLTKSESELATTLGCTFTDKSEWSKNLLQCSGSTVTIHADDDVGVVYFDGKQAGVHINSRKYRIFGLQIGASEKETDQILEQNYGYDSCWFFVDSGGREKTTTYIYYRLEKNDAIAVIMSDVSNRVLAITYYNDYQHVMKEAEDK